MKSAIQIIQEKNIHVTFSNEELDKFVAAMNEYADQFRGKTHIIRHWSVYNPRTIGGKHCYYCGIELYEGINKSKDHFWPKSLGGRLKVRCCKSCNTMKKNFTPEGFIAHLQSLKKLNPDRYFSLKLDRMIFATQGLWRKIKKSI